MSTLFSLASTCAYAYAYAYAPVKTRLYNCHFCHYRLQLHSNYASSLALLETVARISLRIIRGGNQGFKHILSKYLFSLTMYPHLFSFFRPASLGLSDPMDWFRSYYKQGEHSVQSLLQIRYCHEKCTFICRR